MQPFTLFNFTDGLDKSKEDWLIPDLSFETFLNGYVEEAFIKGREGYEGYADGLQGNAPYCESRMVARTAEDTGATGTGTVSITLAENPVRRGTLTLSNTGDSETDDGDGTIAGGTINYTTGVITGAALGSGSGTVTATYDFHPGNPVMMIANYISISNARQLIVADTKYINRYNSVTNRLDDISETYTISSGTQGDPTTIVTTADHNLIDGMQVYFYNEGTATSLNNQTAAVSVTNATTFTVPIDTNGDAGNPADGKVKVVFSGSSSDFFHWTNYPDPDDNNILVFTNNTDPVMFFTGTVVQPFESYTNAKSSSNYEEPDGADAYDPAAGPATFTNLKALRCHYVKDRLILLRPTWNQSGTAKTYPKRILISGFGTKAMRFKSTNAGAGQIDVPDQRWIESSDFNRDDTLIYTSKTPWSLKYTGSDVVPFTLQKLEVSSGFTGGSDAPMATITNDGLTYSYSRSGIFVTDGYKVEAADVQLPKFMFDNVDPENVNLMFSGIEKDDRVLLTLFPSDPETAQSDKILVREFQTNSLSLFDSPFSCLGNYEESFDITWNDLTAANNIPTWYAFGQEYDTWNDIAYLKNSQITIAGGHNGQIWKAFTENSTDAPVRIRGITNAVNPVITTDFNNFKKGDEVYITGTSGSPELNNTVGVIESVSGNYSVTVTTNPQRDPINTWTDSGTIGRVIPFELQTKRFNPFFEQGRQVRVGWVYVYVDVLGNAGDEDILEIEFFSGDYGEAVDSGYESKLPFRLIISNRSGTVTSKQQKMWKKFRVNQTANNIALKLTNMTPLRKFKIHALILGMAAAGPLRDQ